MEGTMRELVRSLQGETGRHTPSDQAQDILAQAYDEPDERRRVQLAQEALTVCPDCADAYVLLAEHARNRKQALELYEKGVAAGERALGPDAFREDVGHFWGLLETRPYMRARLGLAHALWTAGRRDEAVRHLQDMLRLNPGDNQGVRYTLAGFLLFLGRDDDLARLLEAYADDGMAAWAYTKALLAFRRHGDTPEARQLLAEARKTNKHVPAYLTGREYPPPEQPAYYSPGDKSEALEYVAGFMAAWKDTPGAVAWLRANDGKKRKAGAPKARGPAGPVKKRLKEKLPQAFDVWQAGCLQTPQWVRNAAGDLVRPWMTLVTSRSNGLVLAHAMTEEPPAAELLWDTLAGAMQQPMVGEPHRPTELQVRPDERWQSLAPHLEEIGVNLVVSEGLDMLDGLLDDMSAHLGGESEPGLLDVPGVTPAQVAGFYEAAAAFFRQAPWKKVGYESAIKVECGKFASGPWYAVLMGQSGLTAGLALYDDLKALQGMWARDRDDEENARETVATTVTFGEEWEIPVADLDAAKKHGWAVARPDAYPSVFHKDRGMSMRPPLAWELELMEGCLRAVPDFVSRRGQDDPTRETFTVPAASGQLELVLSWVVGSGEAG
jgi:tetratricopeptide (TPR) repeat protein